jgi:hypothetical protein
LRQREAARAAKQAKGQSTGGAQKQPGPPETDPVAEPVLSQPAAATTAEPESGAAPEVPQEEPEPSSEGTQEAESDLPDDAPDWIKKRIARFTRQKGELERKIAEIETERASLRSEMEQARSASPPLPVVVNQADPASQFVNEQQLDTAVSEARHLKRWCERHPDGGTLQVRNGKGGYEQREFSAEQVQSMREAAEDDLEEHLPRRREHLRHEAAITAQAVREHPWLTDKASPRTALFRKVLEGDPSIRLRPDWARVTAIFVRGLEAVEADGKAAAAPPKPKAGTPPPKLPGPSASAPPKKGPIAVGQAELAAAEKEWRETPSHRTFARLQQIKREQRQQTSAG